MSSGKTPTQAEHMFCHAIYTASHLINRAYAPFLRELGVTYPQYITLTLLWERNDQKVSELAGQLEMESNTMTPLLKRLEALAFVERVRGTKDERQVIVSLTSRGKALKSKAPRITECMIERTSLSFLELGQLNQLLGKLREGFHQT